METKVFFEKNENDVVLTSTSANHIANIAKEYLQTIENELENISFLNTKVALIGGQNNIIEIGNTPEYVTKTIKEQLMEVSKVKSLIAWLREAIKAKENLSDSIKRTSFSDFCELHNIEVPEYPKEVHVLTKEEYFDSLSIKERNRYYQLETTAAVLGKYIHLNGNFSKERKRLKDKTQHPHEVKGQGRDALIYTYQPTVPIETVDEVFFDLQKHHREVQAQLNAMNHQCELEIDKSKTDACVKYADDLKEVNEILNDLHLKHSNWIKEESKKCRELKIVIPNSLISIYNKVNSLGK